MSSSRAVCLLFTVEQVAQFISTFSTWLWGKPTSNTHLSYVSRVYQRLRVTAGYLSPCWSAPHSAVVTAQYRHCECTFTVFSWCVTFFFFFLIKLTHQKHYEALELEALLQALTQNTSFSTCGYRLILLHRHQGANPVFLLVGIYGQSGREACLDSLNVFMGHLKSWQELCRGKTFSLHHFLCVTAQQKTYSGALEFLPSLRVIKLRNIPG